jgi:hypothetical protein
MDCLEFFYDADQLLPRLPCRIRAFLKKPLALTTTRQMGDLLLGVNTPKFSCQRQLRRYAQVQRHLALLGGPTFTTSQPQSLVPALAKRCDSEGAHEEDRVVCCWCSLLWIRLVSASRLRRFGKQPRIDKRLHADMGPFR